MPAELSILFRYPCLVQDCGRFFRMKADYDNHKCTVHRFDPVKMPQAITTNRRSGVNNGKVQEVVQAQPKVAQDDMAEKPDEVECTYPKCHKLFTTRSDMLDHKERASEHDYCRKCDVDCKDWEDFMKHKIESAEHICCPVCAIDFKSGGGMERHVKLVHQREHNLVCAGCNEVFARAAALVGHLDAGRCRNNRDPGKAITKAKFQNCVNHKLVIDQIMSFKNPEEAFTGPMNSTRTAPGSSTTAPSGNECWVRQRANTESNNGDHGGVLLDATGEEQSNKFPALAPSTAASATAIGPEGSANNAGESSLIGSYNYRWVGAHRASSSNGMTPSQNDTKRIDGSATAPSSGYEWSNPIPTAQGAWNDTSSTSQQLFPDARPNPTSNPVSFEVGLRERQAEYVRKYPNSASTAGWEVPAINPAKAQRFVEVNAEITGKSINMFTSLFWHPAHPDFSAETFFNRVILRYLCPFNGCDFQSESPTALSNHLKSEMHEARSHRCPVCMRIFGSPTALISHAESASVRCRIRMTDGYGKFMDKMSGGFISVQKGEQFDDEKAGDGEWTHAIGPDDRAKIIERIHRHEPRYEAAKPELFW